MQNSLVRFVKTQIGRSEIKYLILKVLTEEEFLTNEELCERTAKEFGAVRSAVNILYDARLLKRDKPEGEWKKQNRKPYLYSLNPYYTQAIEKVLQDEFVTSRDAIIKVLNEHGGLQEHQIKKYLAHEYHIDCFFINGVLTSLINQGLIISDKPTPVSRKRYYLPQKKEIVALTQKEAVLFVLNQPLTATEIREKIKERYGLSIADSNLHNYLQQFITYKMVTMIPSQKRGQTKYQLIKRVDC